MESTDSKSFDIKACKEVIYKMFDESALPSLIEYIKIPNTSRDFDTQYATNGLLEKAADHVAQWVKSLELKDCTVEIIQHEGYTPIIFTEIKGDLPYTVFYYGHFDKQPAFTGWSEGLGATIPVIREGKLYGRGGADDGYSTYSTMLSIKALQLQGIKLPRCVMITEGDEESGDHIDHYIVALKDKIGDPGVFMCLDSATCDYDTFCLTTSLRGVVSCILTVEVTKEGVHSGDASGIVPSTFRILRQLLSRLEDENTGEVNSAFQSPIPPNRYKEIF
jgi:acetylornithine deacetylase/succinyl-diaminopimelate desuccinylase-like protein